MIDNNATGQEQGAPVDLNGEAPPVSDPVQPPSAPPADSAYFNEPLKQGQEFAHELTEKTKGWLNANGGDVMAVLVASFLLLVCASSDLAKFNNGTLDTLGQDPNKVHAQLGFAVTVGVLSLVMCGVFLLLVKKEMVVPKHRLIFVVILYVWWLIAVFVLTFGVVYHTTGNGYFATWGGFIFASNLFFEEITQTAQYLARFKQLGFQMCTLMIASVVVFISSIEPCTKTCSGAEGFAMSAGIISVIFTIPLIFLANVIPPKVNKIMVIFLAVWWGVAVFICTFIAPFTTTGNGYFGCWAAFGASLLLYLEVRKLEAAEASGASDNEHIDMV